MGNEMKTDVGPQLRVPAELLRIKPDLLRLVLPDLQVSADDSRSSCHSVTFTVTLVPGIFATTGNRAVKVRVLDKVFGVPQIVGEVLLFVPAAGGSTSATIEWPMPPDAQFGPDFFNEITIVADPDNSIAERYDGNNSVTLIGTCVG